MMIVNYTEFKSGAQVAGSHIYIVADESERTVILLNPFNLKKIEVSHADYRKGKPQEIWPTPSTENLHFCHEDDNIKISNILEKKAREYDEAKTAFSAQLVRRCIAALRGIKIEEVPVLKSATGSPRGFAVRSEKRPGVVDAISQILQNGATVDEAVKELAALFPDRAVDGMRTTVRCQINRLPAKLGRTLNQEFVNNRGKVYQWAK